MKVTRPVVRAMPTIYGDRAAFFLSFEGHHHLKPDPYTVKDPRYLRVNVGPKRHFIDTPFKLYPS